MSKYHHVHDLWAVYEQCAVPKRASARERLTTKCAFYSGVHAMLTSMGEMTDFGQDATHLEDIVDELGEFMDDLLARQRAN